MSGAPVQTAMAEHPAGANDHTQKPLDKQLQPVSSSNVSACGQACPTCTDSSQVLSIEVDVPRLRSRCAHYASKAGANSSNNQQMIDMLHSDLAVRILQLPDERLRSIVVNDAYKIPMHHMYSQYMTGVEAEFVLNIRKCKGVDAGYAISDMKQHQPDLYARLQQRVCKELQSTDPLSPAVREVLKEYYDFEPPPVSLVAVCLILVHTLPACNTDNNSYIIKSTGWDEPAIKKWHRTLQPLSGA